MYILRDLWNGKITPSERYICADTEYQKVLHKLCEETDLFLKDFSTEKREHYEELEKMQMNLMSISEEDTFIVGFRLGARMILDVIGEYKGQFMTPADTEQETK